MFWESTGRCTEDSFQLCVVYLRVAAEPGGLKSTGDGDTTWLQNLQSAVEELPPTATSQLIEAPALTCESLAARKGWKLEGIMGR